MNQVLIQQVVDLTNVIVDHNNGVVSQTTTNVPESVVIPSDSGTNEIHDESRQPGIVNEQTSNTISGNIQDKDRINVIDMNL